MCKWEPVHKDDDEYNDDGWGPFPRKKIKEGSDGIG